jgi:hypothetical protein
VGIKGRWREGGKMPTAVHEMMSALHEAGAIVGPLCLLDIPVFFPVRAVSMIAFRVSASRMLDWAPHLIT